MFLTRLIFRLGTVPGVRMNTGALMEQNLNHGLERDIQPGLQAVMESGISK